MRVKALITGAAGFIGSHLTEACLARGWDVVAIDALTTYYSPTVKIDNARHFRAHPTARSSKPICSRSTWGS